MTDSAPAGPPELSVCPRCRRPLPRDAPAGNCPSCLAELGFGSEDGDAAPAAPAVSSGSSPPGPLRSGHPVFSAAAEAPSVEEPGERIGSYKLLQKIGEGGCGVVYMAEQEQPVRRRVALKIIKPGMDSRQVVARFEAERQALAMMDHPNIAKFYDAGITDASRVAEKEKGTSGGIDAPRPAQAATSLLTSLGRPYFVMELVRGVRITEYCDEANLSTRQRLELFIQVCRAVQHAHQKGIIHRDLKPSNILVSINDGVPVPKVIDFGIAKATAGQRLTEKTLFTAFEQFIGTPAYMSPEQALMSNLDVDTRSDIYSLGVLLYELLTGRTPFDQRDLVQGGLDEIRRTIREKEPARPSLRLRTMGPQDLTTAAKRRSTEAPKLIHAVAGDLDWIVMLCLEKDRSRRYETATALAADVERHLHSQPIVARPPTAFYVLQKTIRRNRAACLAASAIVAAVLVGLAVSTTLFLKERRTSRRALLAERAAVAQETQSQQRLLRYQIANGARLLEEGDLMQALPWFVEAYKSDQNHPENEAQHRLRLASILQQCPRPRQMWFHQGTPAVALSPNGKLALTGANDGSSALWDLESGRQLGLAHFPSSSQGWPRCEFAAGGRAAFLARDGAEANDTTALVWDLSGTPPQAHVIAAGERIRHSALSPDGRFFVTCGERRLLAVWDVATGEFVRELTDAPRKVDVSAFISGADARAVFGAATAPAAQVLVAVDREGRLGLWDADRGHLLQKRKLERNPDPGHWNRGKFSADGRLLVQPQGFAGNGPCEARLWDTARERLIARLPHDHHVLGIAFSPDGKTVATCGMDRAARIWDTTTGSLRGAPLQHPEMIYSVGISPSGRVLVTGCEDNAVRLWDVGTGQRIGPPLAHAKTVRSVSFGADDATLATGSSDGCVRVWDLGVAPKWRWSGALNAAQTAFYMNWPLDTRNDPRWGAVLEHDQGVALVGVHGPQPGLVRLPPDQRPQFAMASEDGKRILTGRRAAAHFEYRLWAVETGEPLGPLFAANEPSKSGRILQQLSADGSRFVTTERGQASKSAQVWNTSTGQKAGPGMGLPPKADMVQLSPDGASVVAAVENRLFVWRSSDGQERFPPLEHSGAIDQAAFSGDSRRLVTSSRREAHGNRVARVWDANTGQPIGPPVAQGYDYSYVAFDGAGDRLVSVAGNQARIWDVATGQPLGPSMHAPHPLDMAEFGPEGRTVVGASDDGTVRIWDAATAAPLIAPLTHGARISLGIFLQRAMLLLNGGLLFTFCTEPRCWELPSDARPLEQWERVASLLSTRRLDANGTLEPLDAVMLSNLWTRVRAEAPAEFILSAARRYDWHLWRAEVCMASFDPAGALPHLNPLVAQEPDRLRFRSVRARAHEGLRQWAEAAQDLRVATKLAPDNTHLWSRLAAAELAAGDASAYREVCSALVQHLTTEFDEDALYAATMVVCFGANPPDTLARLADRLSSVPAADQWRVNSWLAFRMGRYEPALEGAANPDGQITRTFLAMTHQALGHDAEARTWLEKARAVRQPSNVGPKVIWWHNVPASLDLAELLLEEAGRMLKR